MAKAQMINMCTAKNLAEFYYQTGEEIWKSITKEAVEKDVRLVEKSIVGNTNMAFACEIILKIIAINEGKSVDDIGNMHDLKKLLEMLSSEKQNRIRSQTVLIFNSKLSKPYYLEENFDDDIEIYKDTFVECRYWYEVPKTNMQGKKAGQLFIYSFATALKNYI